MKYQVRYEEGQAIKQHTAEADYFDVINGLVTFCLRGSAIGSAVAVFAVPQERVLTVERVEL